MRFGIFEKGQPLPWCKAGTDMAIAADLLRGNTDTIILAQLTHGDSYGYSINRAIQKITGGQYELKEATLYTAFRRLEQNGFIISYWGDENTGARRRYYSITPAGRAYYETLLSDWEYSRNIIEQLIR